ncbi:MAG TPA: hypothetical protein VGI16_05645 [Candidatus Acidoferrum sp.]|jgi:hypothetical protein
MVRSRLLTLFLLAAAGYWLAACTAAFGPGYVIDKQQIDVKFNPSPEPRIQIDAEYKLRNNGIAPLSSIELRLPGRHSFHFANPIARWDSQALAIETSPDNPRNVLLQLPQKWSVAASHTLHLAVEYQTSPEDADNLSFSADAFFLPAEGWSPELLPARGAFAFGGVPPKKWNLSVRVPNGFLVHVSGRSVKSSHSGNSQTFRAEQQAKDGYPFVVAGQYTQTNLNASDQPLRLWTRTPQNSAALQTSTATLLRAMQAYDEVFGRRGKNMHDLWIVECPVAARCFSNAPSSYARLIYENDQPQSAEMASGDTVLFNPSGGDSKIVAAIAPSLASSWLGYGQNPGFFEQDPPLSALPAFAASRGREAVEGLQVRNETIRRVLRVIPTDGQPHKPEDPSVVRAKSLLFFYGLQDRYGHEVFRKAVAHMLQARRGGGFDLDDLISAFEQETHQNVAEFVRLWMKHPGVPSEFRARYENSSSAKSIIPKETP